MIIINTKTMYSLSPYQYKKLNKHYFLFALVAGFIAFFAIYAFILQSVRLNECLNLNQITSEQ